MDTSKNSPTDKSAVLSLALFAKNPNAQLLLRVRIFVQITRQIAL